MVFALPTHHSHLVEELRIKTSVKTARRTALVKDLFPPRTLSDAESLATLRDQAVPYLVRPTTGRQTAKAATNCVRALRLINTPTAIRALEGYFDSNEPSVVNELSLAVDPLKLIAVQVAVLSGNTSSLREAISRIQTLESLRGIQGIERLVLYGTQVSDLTPLTDLIALKKLDLSNTPVSDLTPLKDLTALATLELSGTSVSDLTPLKDLTALTTLYLNRTPVSDLTPLKDLIALTELYLEETTVSDLTPMTHLTALTMLDLYGTSVSDLTPLKNLTALSMQHLRETSVSDLTPLKDLTALTRLSLSKEAFINDPFPNRPGLYVYRY